jgi:hypothetical protein
MDQGHNLSFVASRLKGRRRYAANRLGSRIIREVQSPSDSPFLGVERGMKGA